MEINEGFYITLPSNASLDVFQNNTSSSYQVNLAQPLHLDGSWQVAMTEMSYPHTWYNLPIDVAYFEWIKKSKSPEIVSKVKLQMFSGGYYSTISQLKAELESCFRKIDSDVHFYYSPIHRKIEFQGGGQHRFRFPKPLAYMLGIKPDQWIKFDDKSATYPADINAGATHLYCYSNVVSHQRVGDAFAPLLRTVDIKGTFGDTITQYFSPAYYLPVTKTHIENIQIEIKNDQNEPVKFTYGKSVVKLHFRPSKAGQSFAKR